MKSLIFIIFIFACSRKSKIDFRSNTNDSNRNNKGSKIISKRNNDGNLKLNKKLETINDKVNSDINNISKIDNQDKENQFTNISLGVQEETKESNIIKKVTSMDSNVGKSRALDVEDSLEPKILEKKINKNISTNFTEIPDSITSQEEEDNKFVITIEGISRKNSIKNIGSEPIPLVSDLRKTEIPKTYSNIMN